MSRRLGKYFVLFGPAKKVAKIGGMTGRVFLSRSRDSMGVRSYISVPLGISKGFSFFFSDAAPLTPLTEFQSMVAILHGIVSNNNNTVVRTI